MYSPSWDPFCPSGGSFYACGNGTKFVGCCASDPCIAEGGCAAGNLMPTSFPADKYGTFADQQCDAGSFYTCTGTNPVFWGCCLINPCANSGCPREDMAAAYLSGNIAKANDMDPYPSLEGQSTSAAASSSATASASSSGSSTVGGSAAASATSAVASPIPTSASESVPVGAIAGGAAGGFAILCAIIGMIWLVRRHARKSSQQHNKKSRVNTAQELTGSYDGNALSKTAMAEVTAMGSPYRDSPSTVPPYSNQTSPAPHYQPGGWSNQPIQQQGYAQGYSVHEAEARSQFKPYSPNETQGSNHSPYGPPQGQFSPSLSQTSDPMHSATWTNSMGVASRVPAASQYNSQGFARVHQGPPQEMGGDFYPTNTPSNVGLGVHHIGNGDSYAPEPPRVELDARTSSPPPSKP